MSKGKIICTVTNDITHDRRMQRICSSLAEYGFDVLLVGREKSTSVSLGTYAFKTYRLKLKNGSGPLFYYEYNRKLAKYLKSQTADIIYAVDTDTLMAAAKSAKTNKVKLVYDAHEYFSEVPELEHKPVKKWIWKYLEKKYIKQTDARITVGEKLAEIFEQLYNLPFAVVRNVPMLESKNDQSTKEKIILYQGVLNKGRGLETMIDAMADVKDQSITFHLAGGGDIEQELKERAVAKSYAHRIMFHGWQSGDQLVEHTKKAWLGINLLNATSLNYKYSLANKFFDYMHQGVPSLNMDLPEYRAIIDKHEVGFLLSKLDASEVANCINAITTQSYTAMSQATRAAAEEYNWQKDSQVLLATVDQLI